MLLFCSFIGLKLRHVSEGLLHSPCTNKTGGLAVDIVRETVVGWPAAFVHWAWSVNCRSTVVSS